MPGPLPSNSPMLTAAFRHGKRVEIVTPWGDRWRGRVSVSTGRSPTFILLKTRRSLGGMAICEREVAVIRVVE
jgi:hypothetical protein